MPIYAYRCAACGFAEDVLQKISEDPLTVCPSCGKPEFSKQVTAAGFQLKGSGWYVTDFRDGGKKKTGEGDGKKAGAAADKSDTAASTSAGGDSAGTPAASASTPAAPATPAAKPASE